MLKNKLLNLNMKSLFTYSTKLFSNKISKPLVSYELASNIGVVTINNEAKRNALSYAVLENLHMVLDDISKMVNGSDKPKVIILTSEGHVFSAGHDLKELNTFTKEKQHQSFQLCSNIMVKIKNMPQIVISEVQGLATAAGCQIACATDLAIASSKAQFATPGVKVGLFCTTPSVALGRVISEKRAMQMLVTGESISAKTAYEWGILNEVVDVSAEGDNFEAQRKKLREASIRLASQITHYSGDVLSYGKKAFYKQVNMNELDSAYCYASKVMSDNLDFEDTKEGIGAFLQKRKPAFKS